MTGTNSTESEAMQIVRAFANSNAIDNTGHCEWCLSTILFDGLVHEPNCLWLRAKRLVNDIQR